MNNLLIDDSIKTPSISFDYEKGKLEIKGKSIPENALDFYRPVYEWLDSYKDHPKEETAVFIGLEYFNTSSSKCLLDILRRLELLQMSGKSKVTVHWLYETDDEDMMEAGEDYQALVKIPFKIQAI